MESLKTQLIPTGYRLVRDRSNYPQWCRVVTDLLEASGVEAATTPDFATLTFDPDLSGSSSSEEDSDDDLSKRIIKTLSLGDSLVKGKQQSSSSTSSSTSSFPQSSPTPSKSDPQFTPQQTGMQAARQQRTQEMKVKRKERKERKKFEEKKKRMDAKARTIIRSTIDAKAFERSTYDCKTAHQLWEALKPGVHGRRDSQITEQSAH